MEIIGDMSAIVAIMFGIQQLPIQKHVPQNYASHLIGIRRE